MTDIIDSLDSEEKVLEGVVETSHQRQKLFTSLTDMVSFIQAFKIETASYQSGYMQGGTAEKVFQLTYVCVNE